MIRRMFAQSHCSCRSVASRDAIGALFAGWERLFRARDSLAAIAERERAWSGILRYVLAIISIVALEILIRPELVDEDYTLDSALDMSV